MRDDDYSIDAASRCGGTRRLVDRATGKDGLSKLT